MGQPAYLEAKVEGDNSMSVKRLRPESVVEAGSARPARYGESYTA